MNYGPDAVQWLWTLWKAWKTCEIGGPRRSCVWSGES
jgi:hypothetical protein